MADQVPALWGEIIDWLRRNAPVDAGRLRPPAADSLIAEVHATVGRPLPPDLWQWWQRADGAVHVAGVYLIPWGFAPMSCRDALEDRAGRLEIEAENAIDDEDLDDEAHGDEYFYYNFHPHYLPIGDDHCGDCLYVDLREGPEYGFIKFFDHEDSNPSGFYWRSITEMLVEVRDALIDDKPGLLGRALRTTTGPEAFQAYRATATPERELSWVPEKLGPSHPLEETD